MSCSIRPNSANRRGGALARVERAPALRTYSPGSLGVSTAVHPYFSRTRAVDRRGGPILFVTERDAAGDVLAFAGAIATLRRRSLRSWKNLTWKPSSTNALNRRNERRSKAN